MKRTLGGCAPTRTSQTRDLPDDEQVTPVRVPRTTPSRGRRRGVGSALATALLLALSAYLLTGMFLSLAYERYFWLLLGLAGAASFVLRPADSAREVTARRVALPALRSGRR